jgi:hypothetical protein
MLPTKFGKNTSKTKNRMSQMTISKWYDQSALAADQSGF